MNYLEKIWTAFLRPSSGKKKYQEMFERLFQLSLNGMNIGGGGVTSSSGEIFAIKHIQQKLKHLQSIVVFDVGANVGHYSLLLHEHFHLDTRIYAFEPSKKTYQQFVDNTKGLKNLNAYNFGFGAEEGSLTLYSNEAASGLASLYHRRLDHFHIKLDKTEEISIKTIDGFCNLNNIEHIHFLKIDVEGHELKVLEGAKELMEQGRIDYIQFEFGGCNIDSRTYFQDFYYLLKDQFQIYRLVKDGLHPINKYKEIYEAFITTNYLAEKIQKRSK